ncbi:MAG TPA: hypothetical protein DEO60_07890 [Bacteroidales bacterium]|nr:hypothetical protein [Bacteroidales bacterium]HBZ21031.1 hypothetical protein [Bacteroidales bacterium]
MLLKFLLKSIIILFCILSILTLFGCVSSKGFAPGQKTGAPNWKNLYFFHAGDSTWIVKPVTETGNRFTGLIYNPEVIKKSRQVHIYAEPLSFVTISNGKLSVPMENIVRVENSRINPGMIVASVCLVGLLFLIPMVL